VVNELCPENKFDLIFDEAIDGPGLESKFTTSANVIVELEENELSDEEEQDDD
jgi:hypothetical protein